MIFFIINGYFFHKSLTKGLEIGIWLSRSLSRYLFWMFFYAYFWFRFDLEIGYIINTLKFIKRLTVGYGHLWYLSASITTGVVIYGFRKQSDNVLIFLGVNLFVIGTLLQYFGNYHIFTSEYLDQFVSEPLTHRNFIFMGFPFFGFGYLASKNNLDTKLHNDIVPILVEIVEAPM